VGGINHLDGVNLPSKTAIAQITMDLLRLLFPDFSMKNRSILGNQNGDANLMDSVQGRLEDELYKSLEYRHQPCWGGRFASRCP